MNSKERYARDWDVSAAYFYNNGYYKMLCKQIKKSKRVMEIGCGTGFSTLLLLETGHSVVSIDNNKYCIEKAKKLISSKGFVIKDSPFELNKKEVCFIQFDITESIIESTLNSIKCDIVICWNVGTAWDKEMLQGLIPKLQQYGYPMNQISNNYESAYAELIIWHSCHLASVKGCCMHIVERGTYALNTFNDPYYCKLKDEFAFKKIKYINKNAKTLSNTGRKLIQNGSVNNEKEMEIKLISIILS